MTMATKTISERLALARSQFSPDVRLSEPFRDNPPLWIEPLDDELRRDFAAARRWMSKHRSAIEQALLSFGAIVWRGFPVATSEHFADLMGGFEPFAQGYAGGTSDRKVVTGNVMEATRTPPEVTIPLHQEMSYMPTGPRLVAFYCREPSLTGGETVICDMRGMREALPGALREKLTTLDVEYVRNMRSAAVDDWRAEAIYRHPTWQYRFETDDPAVIEVLLEERGAQFEWHADGSLSFWTRVPGMTTHPVTGDILYFNQMNSQVQHPLTIGKDRAAAINAAYGTTTPRAYSVRFSNGEALSEAEFLAIYAAFEQRKIAFPWQAGDVMLLENRLTAHGRNAFTGSRDVQVMLMQ
jgi:alpha-ketoglutarate-dependent taurine dioxygenase